MNSNGSQRQLIVQADASNLKVDVERTLQALAISADAAEQNVATLAALDQGKSNMEQACSTLKVCHHAALCSCFMVSRLGSDSPSKFSRQLTCNRNLDDVSCPMGLLILAFLCRKQRTWQICSKESILSLPAATCNE